MLSVCQKVRVFTVVVPVVLTHLRGWFDTNQQLTESVDSSEQNLYRQLTRSS